MFYIGDFARTVHLDKVTDWLIEEAFKGSGEEAIRTLNTFYEKEKIAIYPTLYLNSSQSNIKKYNFHNGVTFCQLGERNHDNVKGLSFINPSSYILHSSIYQDKLVSNLSTNQPNSLTEEKATTLRKTIEVEKEKLILTQLCLSLAREVNYGVFSSCFATLNELNQFPFLTGLSYQAFSTRSPLFSPSIIKSDFEKADDILFKLSRCNNETQQKFLIPLKYLNYFGSSEEDVDRAISLRVCLDSIFLINDQERNKKAKIAQRINRYLANEQISEKEIKELYSLASEAIHSGKLTERKSHTILNNGAELTKKALIKLIENGPVNWEEIKLQA